jgi:hypothetical protein
MTDRLTRWEGRDENGPRAVLAKEGRFPEIMQEALRKLARYEDKEESIFLPIVGKPMTDRELDEWLARITKECAILVPNKEAN